MSFNATEIVPIIVKALGQAASFEAGQPVSIPIAPFEYTLDLTSEGLGHVQVGESGTTISIKKV